MHGASWQHGAPSLASATVADKAGVDVVDEGRVDPAWHEGSSLAEWWDPNRRFNVSEARLSTPVDRPSPHDT